MNFPRGVFQGLRNNIGAALIVSLASLVQSHIYVKMSLIGLYVSLWGVCVLNGERVRLYTLLVIFYASIASLGLLWGVAGLANGANHVLGITDAVRLYAIWSSVFLILYTIIRSDDGLAMFDKAFVVAGIAIPVINAIGIADAGLGLGIVSQDVREQMELFVGFHDGFLRLSAINIGSMFLVAPYLLARRILSSATGKSNLLESISLALSILLVLVSGRRALWIVLAAAPFIVFLMASLAGRFASVRRTAIRLIMLYTVVAGVGGIVMMTRPGVATEIGGVQHLASAFSSQDERSIQKGYLLREYASAPLLGSGFGAFAGYVRSNEYPWTYELTYHQMLFNIGTLGTLLIVSLFATYFVIVLWECRRNWHANTTVVSLLVAWISLLIGAYSNPYLRSFDYLFFAGMVPWLATLSDNRTRLHRSLALEEIMP